LTTELHRGLENRRTSIS